MLYYRIISYHNCYCVFIVPPAPVINSVAAATTIVTIMWSQTSGYLVDSYTITYLYTFKACPRNGREVGNVTDIDDNTTSYMLIDLKPYADYSMQITAENIYGSSTSGSKNISTGDSSKITIFFEFGCKWSGANIQELFYCIASWKINWLY